MDQKDSILRCSVNIEWVTSNGAMQRKVAAKNASVALKRNQLRDIHLEIVAEKTVPVILKLKNITVHNRFMSDGKASIHFKDERCTLFFANAPSGQLFNFLKVIFIKINDNGNRTPTSKGTLREQLLSGKLTTFDEISPVTSKQLKNVQNKVQTKLSEIIMSPTTGKKRKLNENAAPSAAKKLYKRFTSTEIELSDEQKKVLDACVTGRNVFFTGSAGTGKSFLLKRIIGALPPDVTVATASTGVAACHIGGVTLHSFAGIGSGEASLERCFQLASRPACLQIWKKCKHLIIDEISMVEGSYFEKIEEIARRVRKNDKPFGGIQLILCGDFLQLPPITNSKSAENKKKFCFQTKTWSQCVHYCFELQKVHRQIDSNFVQILNSLRIGRVTDEMQTRLMNTSRQNIEGDGILATKLCSLMRDVNAINEQKLNDLPGEVKIFEATDSDRTMTNQLDQQTPIPSKLELKIGAQVMLMKNLNLSNGLVNGARGLVVKFCDSMPLVRFKNNLEVVIKLEKWSIKSPSGYLYSRRQLPLRLAWAFSIHKSQGLTLDCVEVSLRSVFEAGQAYVALSRAKSMETLRVMDFDAKHVWADPDVLVFYRNFRRQLRQLEIVPVLKKSTALLKSKFR